MGAVRLRAAGVSLGPKAVRRRSAHGRSGAAEQRLTRQRCAVLGGKRVLNAGFEAPVVGAAKMAHLPVSERRGARLGPTSATQVIEVWNDGHETAATKELSSWSSTQIPKIPSGRTRGPHPWAAGDWSLLHRRAQWRRQPRATYRPAEAPIRKAAHEEEVAWSSPQRPVPARRRRGSHAVCVGVALRHQMGNPRCDVFGLVDEP